MEELLNNDTAKEFITYVSYFDEELINRIPEELLTKINTLAAKSEKDYYIEIDKELNEQNISEECKDLLSILYYMYLADDIEKNKIMEEWINNEKE